MVDQRTILELLAKEPFERFRVYISDGHAYEVLKKRGIVAPMETKMFMALPGDRWKFLSYAQVVRIEQMDGKASAP